MVVIYSIIVFIYGLLFGSFFNVVGYRLPNNLSIISPGSFCPKCKHALKWYELIPVFSFFIQKGKCRKCGCRISLFYPFIELLTGILFLLSHLIFGFTLNFALAILISSFFVIVIVSDFSYLIIPDEVTIFFTLVSILLHLYKGFDVMLQSLLGSIFLFCVMYLIMFIGSKLLHEEALGGGDVKLMLFVGSILSPFNGLFEIFVASCLASPAALISYFSKKNRVIPFGPFILLALLIMFYISFDVQDFFIQLANI